MASPISDGVALSPDLPHGVKLKWMKPLPTSEWSLRDVPPAISTSQKLIRLPSVTKLSRIVCFKPTACAVDASSSRIVPSRT